MDAVSYWLAAYLLLTLVGLRFLIKRYRNLRPPVEKLNIEQVQEWLSEGAELWDVRSEREWETGTLKEAKLVEYGSLPARLEPTQKVICYCTSGIRARAMAEDLKKFGVQTTAYFEGGYHHLKSDSYFQVIVPS